MDQKIDKFLAPAYKHFGNAVEVLQPCSPGVSCGVVLPVAVGFEEGFGTLGFKRPVATDPRLQRIINKLYQPSDKVAGGTAGAVRFEDATGIRLSKAMHHQDAANTARQPSSFLSDNPGLTTYDQNLAKHLIQDLLNSLAGKSTP
jgi:hypothetical protein